MQRQHNDLKKEVIELKKTVETLQKQKGVIDHARDMLGLGMSVSNTAPLIALGFTQKAGIRTPASSAWAAATRSATTRSVS